MSTPFAAPHRTPAAGIATWPQPDANVPLGPTVAGGLDVQLLDRWGDWAKIVCSNGWSAWVDGRQLLPRSAATGGGSATGVAPRARSLAIDRSAVVALVGAGLVLLAAVLPWTRGQGSGTSFDVVLKFLVDYEIASNDGPKIGWLLLVIAAGCAVVVLRKVHDRARVACGVAAIAVAVVYLIQVQRLLNAFPDSPDKPGLFDLVGFGVLVAIVGGLIVAFAPKIASRIQR